jgi:hypothetical protein
VKPWVNAVISAFWAARAAVRSESVRAVRVLISRRELAASALRARTRHGLGGAPFDVGEQ